MIGRVISDNDTRRAIHYAYRVYDCQDNTSTCWAIVGMYGSTYDVLIHARQVHARRMKIALMKLEGGVDGDGVARVQSDSRGRT